MKTISCPAFYESASSANFKLHEEQTSNCFIGIIGNTLAKLCSLTCEIKFSQSMCENHTSTTSERWLLDATCPDTLAFSYRANATAGAGEVAAMAEQKKLIKYDSLAPNYDIAPVAIESLGAIGPLSRALLKDLGRRIKESTGEARAHEYLVQRLAVAVQRGNAVSIMGTMGDPGQDFFG